LIAALLNQAHTASTIYRTILHIVNNLSLLSVS